MASAQRIETFDTTPENIYKVLTNYEGYADFMDGVKSVNVIERSANTVKVEYNINIIKKFSYVLTSTEVENKKVSWSFDSGDLFSSNNGSWELKDNGDGTTEVTYNIDIDFKVKVPGMISRKLVSSNLPSMMKSVHKRAKSL
jgi:ribosome-associated toxin RatA of RatAB toxin-antitoxin module